MAIPYKVFDYELYDVENDHAYCLRCGEWIEHVSSPWSGHLDPHIEEHLNVWRAFECLASPL